MEYPQYDRQSQSDIHFEGHHDLNDTLPSARHSAAPDVEMTNSFSYANDMNLFGMLQDNNYPTYNHNNPSMTSMLFQNITDDASNPGTQDVDSAPFTHFSPATMWLGSGSSLSTATMLKPQLGSDQTQIFAHMASPDEDMSIDAQSSSKKSSNRGSARKRRDSQMDVMSVDKKERKESSTSTDDGVVQSAGNKREKYREKNRVAAAKCRAKKKDNVDTLEDRHRTHSVLNVALKQTEQSLRDELSYWRTQALQHSFCDCQSIQDYNMRKARNLAAESVLGDVSTHRPRSSDSHHTCTRSVNNSPVSRVNNTNRRQDSAVMSPRVAEARNASPAAEKESLPFAGPNENASVQTASGGSSLQHRRAKTAKSSQLRFDNIRQDHASKGPSSVSEA